MQAFPTAASPGGQHDADREAARAWHRVRGRARRRALGRGGGDALQCGRSRRCTALAHAARFRSSSPRRSRAPFVFRSRLIHAMRQPRCPVGTDGPSMECNAGRPTGRIRLRHAAHWRGPACQRAARVEFEMEQQTIRETELDCLACGACCRTGRDGRILIPDEDLLRWRRMGREDIANSVQPGHFGMVGFACRADGACVHLGTTASRHACSIYDIRGTTCRDFERGSEQCREFRRDAGLELRRAPSLGRKRG